MFHTFAISPSRPHGCQRCGAFNVLLRNQSRPSIAPDLSQSILESFRPLFLSVDFLDCGKMSDLPPTVGGKSLKFPQPEKSTPSIKGTLGYLWRRKSAYLVDFSCRYSISLSKSIQLESLPSYHYYYYLPLLSPSIPLRLSYHPFYYTVANTPPLNTAKESPYGQVKVRVNL